MWVCNIFSSQPIFHTGKVLAQNCVSHHNRRIFRGNSPHRKDSLSCRRRFNLGQTDQKAHFQMIYAAKQSNEKGTEKFQKKINILTIDKTFQ